MNRSLCTLHCFFFTYFFFFVPSLFHGGDAVTDCPLITTKRYSNFSREINFEAAHFYFTLIPKRIPSYLYVCLRFALGKCRWMLSILPVQATEYISNKPQLINLNVQIYLNIFNSVDINCHEIVTNLPFIRKRQTSMRPMHRWRTHFGYTHFVKCTVSDTV